MAEIKSSIELAMEKTKKFAVSEEERDEMRQKEFLQKVTAFSNRFSTGQISLNEVLREIERTDETQRQKVRRMLILQWIDGLSLDGENGERLLQGIESLHGRELTDVKARFQDLYSSSRKDADRAKEEIKAKLEKALRREGIYGSAVEPNLEVGQELKERLNELGQRYSLQLKDLREQLKNAVVKG